MKRSSDGEMTRHMSVTLGHRHINVHVYIPQIHTVLFTMNIVTYITIQTKIYDDFCLFRFPLVVAYWNESCLV
jgi:hypothetical protein